MRVWVIGSFNRCILYVCYTAKSILSFLSEIIFYWIENIQNLKELFRGSNFKCKMIKIKILF